MQFMQQQTRRATQGRTIEASPDDMALIDLSDNGSSIAGAVRGLAVSFLRTAISRIRFLLAQALLALIALFVGNVCQTLGRLAQESTMLLSTDIRFEDVLGRVYRLQYEHFRHRSMVQKRLEIAFTDMPGVRLIRDNSFRLELAARCWRSEKPRMISWHEWEQEIVPGSRVVIFLTARSFFQSLARCLEFDSGTLKRRVAEYESQDVKASARFVLDVEREMEITGYINLRLWVEAENDTDLDLFAALYKEVSAGKRLHHITLSAADRRRWVESMEEDGKLPATLSYTGPTGRMRVSHRALDAQLSTPDEPMLAHRKEQLLSPGDIVPVDLTLWPTSMIVNEGERLVIEIAGHEVGPLPPKSPPLPGTALSLPTRNRGRHRIHTGGQYDSWLSLPIIPA